MQMIPNLCVGEGGKLSNMGEPQILFFFNGTLDTQGWETEVVELHQEFYILKGRDQPAFTTVTGVDARLPFTKAGCPSESPGEFLEKLWIPGPSSRTTEIIFWFSKWGSWGAERLSNLIISECCQHESNQYHNFNSKNAYFLKPHSRLS